MKKAVVLGLALALISSVSYSAVLFPSYKYYDSKAAYEARVKYEITYLKWQLCMKESVAGCAKVPGKDNSEALKKCVARCAALDKQTGKLQDQYFSHIKALSKDIVECKDNDDRDKMIEKLTREIEDVKYSDMTIWRVRLLQRFVDQIKELKVLEKGETK